jgi:iron(III) transport system permease protein
MDLGLNSMASDSSEIAPPGRSDWLRERMPAPYSVLVAIIAALTAALIFAPVLVMFGKVLFPEASPNISAFVETFSGDGLWLAARNTLLIVIFVNLTAVPTGMLFAWMNFRTDARMGALTTFLPILPLLLPSVALVIGWVFLGSDRTGFLSNWVLMLLRAGGLEIDDLPVHIYGWGGLLFLYYLESMPIVYVVVAAAYRSVNPSLEEAARINGSGVFKTFLTVSVPVVRHAILLSMLLVSVQAVGIYSIAAIIGVPAKIPTISVYLVRLLNGEFPPKFDQAAVLSLLLIVIFGVFWLAQQKLNAFGRHAQIGGQGIRTSVIALNSFAKCLLRALIIIYIALTAVLPVMALGLVALQPYWTPDINPNVLGFDNFRGVFGDALSRQAIYNSMMLAIAASLTTLLVAAVLMVYAVNVGGVRERILGIITKIPAPISHMVIAAGLLISLGGAPFYLAHSPIILWLAYFVLYMPQASIAAEAAARQVGAQLMEASRISGAGGAKTMRRIVLPLMLPGLAAGWALIFAHIVGELTASVILSSPNSPVMGYLIMSIYESGTYSQLAVLALIIAVMSGLTVLITMAIARPKFAIAER